MKYVVGSFTVEQLKAAAELSIGLDILADLLKQLEKTNKEGMPKLKCNRCQCEEYSLQTNGPHFEAVCNNCDAHIKFVSPKQIPQQILKSIRK